MNITHVFTPGQVLLLRDSLLTERGDVAGLLAIAVQVGGDSDHLAVRIVEIDALLAVLRS